MPRKPRVQRHLLPSAPATAPQATPVVGGSDRHPGVPLHDDVDMSIPHNEGTGSAAVAPVTHSPADDDCDDDDGDDGRSRLESVPLELPWTPGGPAHRQIYSNTARSLSPLYVAPSPKGPAVDLPNYLKPLPTTLEAHDIEYLQQKGAFVLPESALMDECLRCYCLYMHPLYAAVDYVHIWSTVHTQSSSGQGKLSLLLLQAVIFAGSMWADVRLIRRAGFLSRKAFRQSVNLRIRVLYDADYEDDPLTLVQSLLLWSFWWKGANDRKDGTYWLGAAYSIARTIDLQRPSAALPKNAAERALQRVRRQLWWALCSREVLASYSGGCEPRFGGGDCTVPMLDLEDFDYGEIMSEALPDMPRPTLTQHLILARLGIQFAKLHQIFGKILSVMYSEKNYAAGRPTGSSSTPHGKSPGNSPSTTTTKRRKTQVSIEQLTACGEELHRWRQDVPEDLWHAGPLPLNPPEWRRAEFGHRAMLCMMYHTALMTVHHPQALSSSKSAVGPASPTGTSERNRRHASRVRARHSAQEITSIAMDFFNADLLTFLPATVVSCLMPVSIRHTLDLFCDDPVIRTEASRHLDECRAMLYTLAERQHAPAWVLQTVEYILTRMKQQQKNSADHMSKSQLRGSSSIGDVAVDDAEGQPARKGGEIIHGDDGPHGSSRYLAQVELANHDTPMLAAPSQSVDFSREPAEMANPSEQASMGPAASSTNANAGQPKWTSFLDNAEGWLDHQFMSMACPDMGSFGALEESWLDFSRMSETAGVGLSWPIGNL